MGARCWPAIEGICEVIGLACASATGKCHDAVVVPGSGVDPMVAAGGDFLKGAGFAGAESDDEAATAAVLFDSLERIVPRETSTVVPG